MCMGLGLGGCEQFQRSQGRASGPFKGRSEEFEGTRSRSAMKKQVYFTEFKCWFTEVFLANGSTVNRTATDFNFHWSTKGRLQVFTWNTIGMCMYLYVFEGYPYGLL